MDQSGKIQRKRPQVAHDEDNLRPTDNMDMFKNLLIGAALFNRNNLLSRPSLIQLSRVRVDLCFDNHAINHGDVIFGSESAIGSGGD